MEDINEDVRGFLEKIGLAEYTKKIEEDGYDLQTLKDLTPDDYEELSKVLSLKPGHKIKLRNALGIQAIVAHGEQHTTPQTPPRKRKIIQVDSPAFRTYFKEKKLKLETDISSYQTQLGFTESLAIHNFYMRTAKLPDSEFSLPENQQAMLSNLYKTFLPYRQKAEKAIREQKGSAFHAIFMEAWKVLGDLNLPAETHPFATPKGFFETAERSTIINHMIQAIFLKELGTGGDVARICKAIIGPKSTGKSTILKTCCTLAALLCTRTLPIYLDYSKQPMTIKIAFQMSCSLRGQSEQDVAKFVCGDEFHANFLPNPEVDSACLKVAYEFHNFPGESVLAIIGSSARLVDYLFHPIERGVEYSAYPRDWNHTKYQPVSLSPLRNQKTIASFIQSLVQSGIKISSGRFQELTSQSMDNLSAGDIVTHLSSPEALKKILTETAGTPGNILVYLMGLGVAIKSLPSEGAEKEVLLQLFYKQQSATYDPWNPTRVTSSFLEKILENTKLTIADLKDKDIIYEASNCGDAKYEFCYPKHFELLAEKSEGSSQITLFDMEVCARFNSAKDELNPWEVLQRLWLYGPNEDRKYQAMSFAKKRPNGNVLWINDCPGKWLEFVSKYKDTWFIFSGDKGLDLFQLDGTVAQLKMTRDKIAKDGSGHHPNIEKIVQRAQTQVDVIRKAFDKKWKHNSLAFTKFQLYAPIIQPNAKKHLEKGITLENKLVAAEYIGGEPLLIEFPKRLQTHLRTAFVQLGII